MATDKTIPVSLSSLLTAISKASALDTVLFGLRSLGFKVTSWQSGGIGLTIAHFLADLVAQYSSTVLQIAKGGFLDYATGNWLTILADNLFDEQRKVSTKTAGTMLLASSAGAPPYTIVPYQIWATTPAGHRFVNTSGGTIASGAGETLELTWEAESAGAEYNIPSGATLTWVTPLPGVTLTNPSGTGGDWLSSPGTDEESDDSLKAKCRAKWATRSYQRPAGAYEYWAKSASDSVTRVFVDDQNPDGPGTLRVYLAGASGGISDTGVISAVDSVLQLRKGPTSQVLTLGTSESVVNITGTVYVRGYTATEAETSVDSKIASLFASIPIRGEVIGEEPGAVFRDAIIETIRAGTGVIKVNLTFPAADLVLGGPVVAVPNTSGLTYEVVS